MVAVASRVLDLVASQDFLAEVRATGEYLGQRLSELGRAHGLTPRGRGLLWALVLPSERGPDIVEACFARGLLINAARPNVLRFMPSLRVTRAEIDEFVEILTAALGAPS